MRYKQLKKKPASYLLNLKTHMKESGMLYQKVLCYAVG